MINFYYVQLNVFAEIHDVFHVNLLKSVFTDFLLSQITDDGQLSAIIMNNEKEYKIKNII